MHAYLGAIWNCRYFWLSLVKMDLRFPLSRLGPRHRLVAAAPHRHDDHPVRGVPFRVRQDLRTYAPFVFIGMTFWGFFSLGVWCKAAVVSSRANPTSASFPAPMAIYPLRTVLGAAFHFSVGMLAGHRIGLCVRADRNLGLSRGRAGAGACPA